MTPLSESDIASLVSEVIRRMEAQSPAAPVSGSAAGRSALGAGSAGGAAPTASGAFVFSGVDQAVQAAARSQEQFQAMGLEARRKIIESMRRAGIGNAETLAKLAREETGLGRTQDKIQKNLLVSRKTPGVEDLRSRCYTGDQGLTLVEYAPFGVVGAVTPSTNPTSTIINNSISILSAGNAVAFAPHPAAYGCCVETMRLLNEAIVQAGGPPHLIVTLEKITHETTRELLAHPRVRLNMVTGGPAIVKVAMTIGKNCKTIAAGPGNPPAVVDETAVFPKCARDIITGAGFDNCVLCTAEKEVIVTQAARGRFLEAMRGDLRAYELSAAQMDQLTQKVIIEGGRGCKDPKLNREFIGKDAAVIARAIGLNVAPSTTVLWAEVDAEHPMIWTEQLMPVLPVTTVADVDGAIELAYWAEGENHHTASMHSMNVDHLTRMARRMACSIYVKNAPTLYGLGMGEGYATMSIGTPTGDGMTKASHFVRPLHCSLVGYFRIA
ncbi:MAG: hypothetical protein A3G41_02795 [Elusimicrobia bacterium RIFCSPLOWO2_12_FULL_59_9]|nr:MAG: hypothetical protein A3G41_02795 [Elusimicrobia bacterium RIFCSPLOWO2_12_FULL_59_9]